MSKTIFNANQMHLIEQNPNVNKVSDRSITYNPDFKVQAFKLNLYTSSYQWTLKKMTSNQYRDHLLAA